MGCLVNLAKIILGLILIVIMLFTAYKLVHEPYRPEDFQQTSTQEYQPQESKTDITYEVPKQSGENHDYIMENTFQKPGVVMELTPKLEIGLVYVIKVFKSVLGTDFTPTIISAHDSFNRHDQWSPHRTGRAVDIRLDDLPLKQKRKVVRILQNTIPEHYKVRWENQFLSTEYLHFESKH